MSEEIPLDEFEDATRDEVQALRGRIAELETRVRLWRNSAEVRGREVVALRRKLNPDIIEDDSLDAIQARVAELTRERDEARAERNAESRRALQAERERDRILELDGDQNSLHGEPYESLTHAMEILRGCTQPYNGEQAQAVACVLAQWHQKWVLAVDTLHGSVAAARREALEEAAEFVSGVCGYDILADRVRALAAAPMRPTEARVAELERGEVMSEEIPLNECIGREEREDATRDEVQATLDRIAKLEKDSLDAIRARVAELERERDEALLAVRDVTHHPCPLAGCREYRRLFGWLEEARRQADEHDLHAP